MILIVDPHSGIPVFKQIVEQLRFHVASGLVEPGEEIPSTRALSARLGVNPMTVSKAYGLLEEEGLLVRRPGRPLVVRERDDTAMRASRLEQLERDLRPLAIRTRQLEIEPDEALALFRRLLAERERGDS